MNQREQLRRMFVFFHIVLGVTLLVGSVLTAWNGGHGDIHVRLLGTVEAVGALMLLFPRTLRPGAWLLLLTFGVALVIRVMMGQWRGDLLVYAAGVAFVMVHGEAYSHRPGPASV
jgi:hypothetical protein